MEENTNYYVPVDQQQENEMATETPQLTTALGSAFAYFFSMLAFILFICPFAFWKGATMRLYNACQSKGLKTFIHQSRWPFFSFCKKVFFEFCIDGVIFISYFVGIIAAFIVLFDGGGFEGYVATLVAFYYSPMFLSWIRDLCVLALLPFQKFLSWVSKPSQQIDVDFHNR